MAVCMVFTPPKDLFNRETYQAVLDHLGDAFPPPTMSLHLAGANDQGEFRIVDIFESAQAFEEFAASQMPVYEQLGMSLDDIKKHVTLFEIEKRLK